MNRFASIILTALASVAIPGAALAQASTSTPALNLQLNDMQPSSGSCILTFVITNDLGKSLDKVAFEMALFDDAGAVNKLTVFDFHDLPAGKTRVARFSLAGTDCGKIGRVLVNGAKVCSGAGVDPKACVDDLKTTTRTKIRFGS